MERKDLLLNLEGIILDAVSATADKTKLVANPASEIMIKAIMDNLLSPGNSWIWKELAQDRPNR